MQFLDDEMSTWTLEFTWITNTILQAKKYFKLKPDKKNHVDSDILRRHYVTEKFYLNRIDNKLIV